MKIAYISVYRDGTGYSNAAINNILSIEKMGINIVCRPISLSSTINQDQCVVKDLEDKDLNNITHIIQHVLPHMFEYKSGVKNIGYLDWETDNILRSNWANCCNLMDAIFVPCEANKQALINSGVKSKIFIIPHACNHERFKVKQDKINLGVHKNKCIFYNIGELNKRKNLPGLIRAYYSAFSSRDDVVLVVKTNMPGKTPEEVQNEIKTMCADIRKYVHIYPQDSKYPPILMISNRLNNQELDKLHATGDIFVSLSKGEGWNIPAHDAMCWGNIPILSSTGGHITITQSNNDYLVSGTETPCFGVVDGFNDLYTGKEFWFEADLKDAINKMKSFYKHWHNNILFSNIRENVRKIGLTFDYNYVGGLIKRAIEEI